MDSTFQKAKQIRGTESRERLDSAGSLSAMGWHGGISVNVYVLEADVFGRSVQMTS